METVTSKQPWSATRSNAFYFPSPLFRVQPFIPKWLCTQQIHGELTLCHACNTNWDSQHFGQAITEIID